jgi:murein DD-endopeptidase MepM/ murein hydrolase activator NlpD
LKDNWFKKILSARFTFMVVPHGGSRPRQVNIHFSFILIITLIWAGITFWGSYLSAQHVDYWRGQVSNQAMKLKIKYLLAQLDQSRQYLDEVKTVDAQLRELIQHQNEASILKNDQPLKSQTAPHTDGTGGPTIADANELSRLLQGNESDLSWPILVNKVSLTKNEAMARLTSFNELTNWIEIQRRLFRATPRGWPCQGQLSSHYGQRKSPFDGIAEFHPGIDISNSQGTAIRATADGVVRLASWNSGYGNLVLLQHEFGFSTRYAHNSKILVNVGDHVK